MFRRQANTSDSFSHLSLPPSARRGYPVPVPHRPFVHLLPLALLAIGSHAYAQDSTADARFRLSPVHPASAHSPFFMTEGPVADPSATPVFAGSLIIDYARKPLTLEIDDANGQRSTPLVEDTLVLHSTVDAHLSQALSLDASWSVAAVQTGDAQSVDGVTFYSPQSGAVGDIRLGALTRGPISNHLGYLAGIRLWAPTGNEQDLMSDGRFRFEALAGLAGSADGVRHGCTLFASPLFTTKEPGERVGGACAVDLRLFTAGPRLGAELWGAALYQHPDLGAQSILEFLGTVGHHTGPLHVTLGLGRGAGSAPGTSALRALALLRFVPDPATPPTAKPKLNDRDLDGISDEDDACPDEAGPASRDARRHGCPIKDSDGDGIEDAFDACPKEAGTRREDPETTGCPDRDNDRVVDKLDECPTEPAPTYDDGIRPGCPRHARVQGDRFALSPPIDPLDTSDESMRNLVLGEVAFILRAMPHLTKIAIEVHLPVTDERDETETADLALDRAHALAQRLVDLGVERSRLETVGASSGKKPRLRLLIVEQVTPRVRR